MKKPNYEKLKTIILAILVISSIVLTYRLWFKDHNLFSIIGIFNETKVGLKNQNGLEYVYSPKKIVVNLGKSSHAIIKTNNEEYLPLQKEGIKIITQILKNQKFDIVDIEEWNKLLSSKSILYGYQTQIDTELLVNLFNLNNTNIKSTIPSIKEFIITQDSTVSNNIKCYIKDELSNKLFICEFNYDDINLGNILGKIEEKEQDNYITAYEGNETKKKILKEDVFILSENDILIGKKIEFVNEIDINSSNQVKDVAQKFFDKLDIVKNIEYKDESKTKIIQKEFIDRNRILRLFSNGEIEYSSADIQNEKSNDDMATSLKNAISFIESNLDFPKNSYISEIRKISANDYLFCFDYSIDGFEVKLTGNNVPKHAIEIEVSGNSIVRYKRFVKNYTIGKDMQLNVTDINAVDQSIIKYRSKTGKKEIDKDVSDVKLVYVDDSLAKDVYPFWFVKVGEEEFLINSWNEED